MMYKTEHYTRPLRRQEKIEEWKENIQRRVAPRRFDEPRDDFPPRLLAVLGWLPQA